MTTATRYGAAAFAVLAVAGCTARQATATATATATADRSAGPAATSSGLVTTHPAPSRVSQPTFPTTEPKGGLRSEAAARLLADQVVAAVPIPSPAQLQPGSPPARLGPGTTVYVDTKVDVARWYTVPGTRDSVVAWFKAHGPAGFRFFELVKTSGPRPATSYPRFLGLGSDTPSRQPLGDTEVSVLQDGDRVDVRVGVEVIWAPDKTAIEIIPASVTTGVVQYRRPAEAGQPALDRSHRLTQAQVARLRKTLNGLRPVPLGEQSCSPAPDEIALTFHYSGKTVVFSIDTGGCGFITVAADGAVQRPYTRGGSGLGLLIRPMLGLPAKPLPAI